MAPQEHVQTESHCLICEWCLTSEYITGLDKVAQTHP